MKLLLHTFWLVATGLALTLPATAQTAERRTGLGFNLSGLQYEGDFGSDYWKWSNTRLAPGLSINQYLTRGLDLNTQVFYSELQGRRSTDTHFKTTLINANLGFKLKLNNGWMLKENAFIQPYLLAATGWTYASREGQFKGASIDLNKGYMDIFGAAGISFRLGRGLNLFVQTGQHLPMNANFDGTQEQETPRWSDRYLQHTVGLTFNMGQAPDQDEDNVPDRLDKCPNTPAGIAVDAKGCPLDGDGDGVADYLDACPSEAGTVELRGCPDQDNDGITDSEDNCPEVAGKPELHGCPDADNDGIVDQEDKCPDTPAGTQVDFTGCPVQAEPAAAPAAPVAPDADSDGVPDAEDACPNSAGPATNHGCPQLKEETQQRLREATRSIRFALGKATLLPSSFPTLDAMVPILSEYPDYSLSIAGHTDSQGAEALNLNLSRARAAEARRYLIGKGVAEDRVVLHGYGAQHPIADNATEAGRARNRRVEFDLYVSRETNAAELKYGPEPTAPAVAPPKKAPKAAAPKRHISRKAAVKGKAGQKSRPGRAAARPVPAPKAAAVKPAAPRAKAPRR